LPIDSVPGSTAASSLTIVPAPEASLIVAPPVAPDSVTAKVSLASNIVSLATCTVIVRLVSPSAKSTVPPAIEAKSVSSVVPFERL
jgi:hypothetical protein